MTKLICYSLTSLIIFTACSKKNDTPASDITLTNTPVNSIDVSKQWNIDPTGFVISSFPDGQWQMKAYSTPELNLFSSLDTANLNGTNTPGLVSEISPNFNSIYPNPFSSIYSLGLRFNSGFAGDIVFKAVVTDSTLTPVFKTSARINVSNNVTHLSFNPSIPNGIFRFYYTLSSLSNPHFYKTWGNIQKM